MGEPAPWDSWGSFSDVSNNSASFNIDVGPTSADVGNQVKSNDTNTISVLGGSEHRDSSGYNSGYIASVPSGPSIPSGSGGGCTSCQHSKNSPSNKGSGNGHHPFRPKEEDEEEEVEYVGLVVHSQLRMIANEIRILEVMVKSGESQNKVSSIAYDLEKAIAHLSLSVSTNHRKAVDAKDVLAALEAGRDKLYNISKMNDSHTSLKQSYDVKRMLMLNAIFIPLILLGGVYIIQGDSKRNDIVLGAGALCLLILIYILRIGE